MLYCPNCQRLCKSQCPSCSDTRSLRAPQPDDPVFLFIANEFQRMMVEPVLEESGLPYWAVSQRGGALRAKLAVEKLRELREGKPVPPELTLPVSLVVRGSTGPCRLSDCTNMQV